MKRTFIIILLSLLSFAVQAQDITVKGKVTDSSGAPLAGVFVLHQGTELGTFTDSAGEYSINVPEEDRKSVV